MPAPVEGITVVGNLVWEIIKANRPAVQKSLPHVHALPTDAKNWAQLDQWKGPVRKKFVVLFVNGFKTQTVKLEFILQYFYAGKFNGRGNYLANVVVVPRETQAFWGYTANLAAVATDPINRGTKKDPIAELPLSIQVELSTPFSTSAGAINLRILGTGQLIVDDKVAPAGTILKTFE